MNVPTMDTICLKINTIYKYLDFYIRIVKICFQRNSKLDRIANRAALKDRWLIASVKIYLFNCCFLVLFNLIFGNYFYKDIFNISKGNTDNLYIDPLDTVLYIIGLFIAPSVITLIIKVSYKKTTGRRINTRKMLAKICMASTICMPFLPIKLIWRSLMNMFPLELYGRLWIRSEILLYEKFIFIISFFAWICLMVGMIYWWYRIIRYKAEKIKKKFYIYASLLALTYTVLFPGIMSVINISEIMIQTYGTADRIIRGIKSIDNNDSRMFMLLLEYIDDDDNLTEEEKNQLKTLNMMYILKSGVQDKSHINAAKDYIISKEYAKGKNEIEKIILEDDSKYRDVLALAKLYVNKLNQSSDNENFKKKNNGSIKIDKINPLLTLCPM